MIDTAPLTIDKTFLERQIYSTISSETLESIHHTVFIMAPSIAELPPSGLETSKTIPIKPWSRPEPTKEDLDWAPLVEIDLSRFDEPGGKEALADQLRDAVTNVGFWVVTGTGIEDERVLRQFSIGNTFFQEPLEEKRKHPCHFERGECECKLSLM